MFSLRRVKHFPFQQPLRFLPCSNGGVFGTYQDHHQRKIDELTDKLCTLNSLVVKYDAFKDIKMESQEEKDMLKKITEWHIEHRSRDFDRDFGDVVYKETRAREVYMRECGRIAGAIISDKGQVSTEDPRFKNDERYVNSLKKWEDAKHNVGIMKKWQEKVETIHTCKEAQSRFDDWSHELKK